MLRFSTRLFATYTAADIKTKLESSAVLQPVQSVRVEDRSAGCGSFFHIAIVSSVFDGKPLIQQHRLVNSVLKDEISAIHGFTLDTRAK